MPLARWANETEQGKRRALHEAAEGPRRSTERPATWGSAAAWWDEHRQHRHLVAQDRLEEGQLCLQRALALVGAVIHRHTGQRSGR